MGRPARRSGARRAPLDGVQGVGGVVGAGAGLAVDAEQFLKRRGGKLVGQRGLPRPGVVERSDVIPVAGAAPQDALGGLQGALGGLHHRQERDLGGRANL